MILSSLISKPKLKKTLSTATSGPPAAATAHANLLQETVSPDTSMKIQSILRNSKLNKILSWFYA